MVLCACACSVTSIVSDCVTPWTVALQPPLSMGFSRQEFWSGFHALFQGIFLTQRSNLHLPSPALQVNSLQLSHRGSPEMALYNLLNIYVCVCMCVCVCVCVWVSVCVCVCVCALFSVIYFPHLPESFSWSVFVCLDRVKACVPGALVFVEFSLFIGSYFVFLNWMILSF